MDRMRIENTKIKQKKINTKDAAIYKIVKEVSEYSQSSFSGIKNQLNKQKELEKVLKSKGMPGKRSLLSNFMLRNQISNTD